MSDGKDYEIFVQNLQQALINSEELMKQKNIEVERNKKIKDNYGIIREFDLYWEYELAGVTYKTIIECKDYASRVSIDKIDSLIGKIRDIPDLKPVFATKTGYQSGAEAKAKNNKIDLLIVREQRDDDWDDHEGNPLIKKINVNIKIISPARITNFKPFIDGDWVKKNTHINIDNQLEYLGLNDEIFIEDIQRGETYSLLELATKLERTSNGFGEQTYSEAFDDAYLVSNGFKLKLCKYEVDYIISEPINQPIEMDFSKELVGVIEYLNKGSSTAIFKDKIVKDWK